MLRYKDGYTEEDFDIVEDPFKREMIKRVFTMGNSSTGERYDARRLAAIKKFQQHPFDMSTPAVQAAMISEKIYLLVIRFQKEKKRDIMAYRRVQYLLYKRSKLLEYVRWTDYNRYY